ncbi:prepilin-type N-terminal cleavage/methylation domain-containing protein [bacterium]|nr:prepilin-type N-terminal cleavage/methylation domain-containing protein [bacterium]
MINMRAFTMIELILSIALLAIVVGFSIPLFPQYGRTNMQINSGLVVDSIRSAQFFSLSQKDDSDWCVYMKEGSILINKKNIDEAFAKSIEISESISFSGINNICFDYKGFPDKDGEIILNEGKNSKVFLLNKNGVLDY